MNSILRLPLRAAGRSLDLALTSVKTLGSVAGHLAGRARSGPDEPKVPDVPVDRPRPRPTRAPTGEPSPPPTAPAVSTTEGPAAGAAFAPAPAEDAYDGPPEMEFAPPEPTTAEVGEHRLSRREEERTDDSPGATVHVDEPWPGYAAMTAPDIVDRLVVADPAERAVVLLYEQSHRSRKTVLEAALAEP